MKALLMFAFLALFSEICAAQTFAWSDTEVLNARNGAPIRYIKRGSQITVYQTSGPWSRISVDGLPEQWVLSENLCFGHNCWRRPTTPTNENKSPARQTAAPNQNSNSLEYRLMVAADEIARKYPQLNDKSPMVDKVLIQDILNYRDHLVFNNNRDPVDALFESVSFFEKEGRLGNNAPQSKLNKDIYFQVFKSGVGGGLTVLIFAFAIWLFKFIFGSKNN